VRRGEEAGSRTPPARRSPCGTGCETARSWRPGVFLTGALHLPPTPEPWRALHPVSRPPFAHGMLSDQLDLQAATSQDI